MLFKATITKILFTSSVFLACQGIYAAGVMRNIKSMDLVHDMKIGWNLGNTLDATDGSGLNTETSWGNPVTTKAMLDLIKAKGFKTVRIPVTWNKHFGEAPDYAIDNAWLDRVEEVVNYVLDNQMYAILNTHHDEWVTLTTASQTQITDKLVKIWNQIANRFKDYSDYLVFETLNEPRLYGTQYEWNGGTPEARSVLNAYNAAVVSAIRATGGNNALRHIMIPTHAATAMAVAQDALVIPNNDSRIIISQHTYWPYSFTMQEPGTNTWGTDKDKAECDAELDRIRAKFVSRGIPVVIGEWGTVNKNNTAARAFHAEYYTRAVIERGMLPVWWDNGFEGLNTGFALLDRKNLGWHFPEIADALIKGTNNWIPLNNRKAKECNFQVRSLSSSSGVISYTLNQRSDLTLHAFDMQGRVAFKLIRSAQPAGQYKIDLTGSGIPAGFYMLDLKAGNYSESGNVRILY